MTTEIHGQHNHRPSVTRSSGLALVGVAAIVAISACGVSRRADTPEHQPPPLASSAPLNPPIEPPSAYRTAVIASVVQGLQGSPDEVRTELQGDPNATLMNVAKPRGLDQAELATIMLSALKDAGDSRVAAHAWTVDQASQEQRFWAAQPEGSLIAEVSRWFREP